MSFTGINDLDMKILENLDDVDLVNMCSTNKHFNRLGKNEMFWKNRAIKRFGLYFNLEQINKFHNQKQTWKRYYISLAVFINNGYSTMSSMRKRDDLKILNKIVLKNTEELENEILYNFKEYKWKKLITQDLIKLHDIFSLFTELSSEKCEMLLDYLLTSTDRRINPNDALEYFIVRLYDDEGKLIDKLLKDPRILVKRVIENILMSESSKGMEHCLSFIKEKNAFDILDSEITNLEDWEKNVNHDTINYIYSFFERKKPILPQIYELLSSKRLTPSEYGRILCFIKNI